MVEKEHLPEKKKRVSCKRFFKYLGLVLLAFMLIASIIFQAPWKIITILAIILACCTILPKPARKWFWLSVGVIVIALIIWVFLPVDNEGWRPYTFDNELAALQAKYTIPDEENAFFAYDEIFENLDIDANQPEFFTYSKPSSKDGPWLSKDHPEMAEWLKGQQGTIGKLLQAAKKDKCIFLPISADLIGFGNYMEPLPKMRKCAFLLVSAANNDMAEGRTDAALEKCFCNIQMAKHLYQQPVMIQQLVGLAIEQVVLERLNRFIIEGQPQPEQLQLIANSLIGAENNWGPDWRKMMDFEKLYAKNMFCSIAYEKNAEGKIRFTRDLSAQWRKQSPQEFPPPTYLQKKLFKAKTILNWLNYPSSPEKLAKTFDAGFEKHYAMAEPDFDWSKEPAEYQTNWKANYRSLIKLLTSTSYPAYYKIHELYLRGLASRRGSRLLVAIKQYEIENNNWPETLDDIKSKAPAKAFIDPVSGNEFEYENHGETFSLFGEKTNIWPK
jgi:hypothetical protein